MKSNNNPGCSPILPKLLDLTALLKRTFILAIALSIACSSSGQATMLQGYVVEQASPPATPSSTTPGATQPGASHTMRAEAQSQQFINAPQAMMAPPSHVVRGNAQIDFLPEARARAMQGEWLCLTQVTQSSTAGVTPGMTVRCRVNYTRDNQGNLVENWSQDGWTPSSGAVVKLDSANITVSHVSCLPSRQGVISAQSTDVLSLLSPSTMIAEGLVNQYRDGEFIGQYRTSSMLRRAS